MKTSTIIFKLFTLPQLRRIVTLDAEDITC